MKRYLLLFLTLCASVAQAQTIADKLTTINSIKQDIKAALASKSQTVGDDFSLYDDAVASITAAGIPASFTLDSVTVAEDISANELCVIRGNYPWAPTATSPSAVPDKYVGFSKSTSISGDGEFMAVAHEATTTPNKYLTTYKWNSTTNNYVVTTAASELPTSVGRCTALNYDGSRLLVLYCTGPTFNLKCYAWDGDHYVKGNDPDDKIGGSRGLAMSGDGLLAATSNSNGGLGETGLFKTYKWNDTNVRFEKTATATPQIASTTYIDCMAMDYDGSRLVTAVASTCKIISYDWDAGDNRYEGIPAHDVDPMNNYTIGLSSDATYLAVGGTASPYCVTYKFDGTRYIAMPALSPAPNGGVGGTAFSADGKYLFIAGAFTSPSNYVAMYVLDPIVNVYRAITAPTATTITNVAKGTAISADGSRMAVGHSVFSGTGLYTYNLIESFVGWKCYPLPSMSWMASDARYIGWVTEDKTTDETASFSAIWCQDRFTNYE